MAKKIGFIGNCQLGTLSILYSRLIADQSDVEVSYIPSYKPPDDDQRKIIAAADVIVRQVHDFDQEIGEIKTDASVLLFPHVTGAFLWPYGGQEHPRNTTFPYFDESGPYPGEMGDSFLNRMIAEQVDADQAVSEYEKTDVANVKRLDRLKELVLEKQRARDRACGYDFAGIIEARFRTESLFRTPNHLEIPLTMILAEQLFGRLGMDSAIVAAAAAAPPPGLFPASATPIHPAVAEKFGLTYADKSSRYRYFEEGSFTFAEYCSRYMRFEWNAGLAEGLYWHRHNEPEKALALLESSIAASPRSAIGRMVLSDLLARKGRLTEAVQHARSAAALEPDNPHHRKKLVHLLTQQPRAARQDEAAADEPVLDAKLAVAFGVGGNARPFLHEGWGAPEPGFMWTTGRRASLRVKKKPSAAGYIMTFMVAPFAPAERPYQRCSVLLNDVALAEVHVTRQEEHSVWIPSDIVAESAEHMTITFDLPDAARPIDFPGGNTDKRQLGLSFKYLTLERLGSIAD